MRNNEATVDAAIKAWARDSAIATMKLKHMLI